MNPYGFLHTPLKRARLPISPPERIAENRERQYITIKGCVKAHSSPIVYSHVGSTGFSPGRFSAMRKYPCTMRVWITDAPSVR